MHETEQVNIAAQGNTGVRKLPIFEQIYAAGKMADKEEMSQSEFSDREEDSLIATSTGSPNDSSIDLDRSSFDDIVESICGSSDTKDQLSSEHSD